MLRGIQDQTGGFTEFVPLPFVHQSSPLYLAGGARPGPTHRDNRAVHALARIMLHGRISNIQTSWVKLGVQRTQVMLNGGANDLGGTLMEETISRMAGSEFGSAKSVEELVAIAAGIGRPARQRTTTYAPAARSTADTRPADLHLEAEVRDMTEILTSMCARLYGKRAAQNRAKRALAAAASR